MSRRTAQKIIEEILKKRGISDEDYEKYLNPSFEQGLYDPFLMLGMREAVDCLVGLISNPQEKSLKLGIFGDYDADGIPASALLYRGLNELGITPKVYIPTRAEGYGLSPQSIQKIIDDEIGILITVDNGIVARDEIKQLTEAGIQVIVIDHHNPDAERKVEGAVAIINPKQTECQYPFKEMCGCGLAWKFLWALYFELKEDGNKLKWLLDLVAIATVSDMVQLRDENRMLVYYGLKVIAKTRNKGIKALCDVSGVNIKNVTSGDIGFRIAPRLNAPSRMHSEEINSENISLELLISEDEQKVSANAKYLNDQNLARQGMLERQLQEAKIQFESRENKNDLLFAVLYDPGWSTGVVGLLAGRLTECYGIGFMVLANEGDEVKGSLRAPNGESCIEIMESVKGHLKRYGGHAKAGGVTMEIGAPLNEVEQNINKCLSDKGLNKSTLAHLNRPEEDISLVPEEINLDLIRLLDKLEPFGVGFPRPLIRVGGIPKGVKACGKEGQHVSLLLAGEQRSLKLMAFSMQDDLAYLTESEQKNVRVDVLTVLHLNEWNGVESPVGYVRAIHKETPAKVNDQGKGSGKIEGTDDLILLPVAETVGYSS